MKPRRFRDPGTFLWQYAAHVLVRCPRCAGCAQVRRTESPSFGPARLTCLACGYTAQLPAQRSYPTSALWSGPVSGAVRRRCEHCGRWLPSTVTRRRRAQLAQPVRLLCAGCRHTTDVTATAITPISDEPLDPAFGLPLWLQAPCRGVTLWAYNAEHLRLIKDFVSASVRERIPYHNSSIISRLPAWIKAAKHRPDVLRAIARLEATLTQSFGPPSPTRGRGPG